MLETSTFFYLKDNALNNAPLKRDFLKWTNKMRWRDILEIFVYISI